jgi:hypothetical protein
MGKRRAVIKKSPAKKAKKSGKPSHTAPPSKAPNMKTLKPQTRVTPGKSVIVETERDDDPKPA